MQAWLRLAYRVPLLDRLASEWMWWRGGWDVEPAGGVITDEMIAVPLDDPPGSIAELRGD
jgi:hypothetical protein